MTRKYPFFDIDGTTDTTKAPVGTSDTANAPTDASSKQGIPQLEETDRGLALYVDDMELIADFDAMAPRLRPGRLKAELLVQAARMRGAASPTAFDATAGLGEDALLLAAAGFTVTMCERDATIAALLRDALERGSNDSVVADALTRMTLIEGDSLEELAKLGHAPDVVYLDPMFPERTKSAAVKKKFQVLHYLEAPCDQQEELLQAAIAAHPCKVIIKRPLKGELLAGFKPAYRIQGKAIRYDVIVPAQLPHKA